MTKPVVVIIPPEISAKLLSLIKKLIKYINYTILPQLSLADRGRCMSQQQILTSICCIKQFPLTNGMKVCSPLPSPIPKKGFLNCPSEKII